ncbi:ribosomal protein L11 methyltransferase [Alkalithermobacter thermoalcaliphilus JW-YL-7 = DSM 7308]|uniref:Ribosomal protein L11 methyltransferase n=1 Tax=Alkalithermobacter thermoalcaliphilus JW-YL-7 = DSM 7308 TaxID=1121328 RepID=A0A150FR37_CLOPD|nr:Ribosomal protein L11 methyltransferase [[Clostridium] paradoxum JW-YL-7 = DSM 7308]SHL01139.1 ribosomal protein L11 methyltransferase [[Clostridium] paradoxum JW-YL-7 = DSM 7308]
MKWIEITIRTTTEATEAVTNILYESGVGGVVIEDSSDFLFQEKNETDWDYIEEEIFNKGYEGSIIKAYLSEENNVVAQIEMIREKIKLLPSYGLDIGEGSIEITQVDEKDWANAWKQYYKPTKVSDKIVIKPTWEDYDPKNDEIIIQLDPGMAFGTGTHETTKMCIIELENVLDKDKTVFDIGCGSGILSIAAAKLGAKKVVGVDLDPVAVKVSKENVKINNVEEIVDIRHGNLMDVIDEKADVIVANIIADIIILLSKDIGKFLYSEGVFISSGIILDKIEDVKKALEDNKFKILDIKTMGEWAVIVSKKGE